MESSKTFVNDQLKIEMAEDDKVITLRFLGKSILRDPNDFILPILLKTFADATIAAKRVVMDFKDLAYMNSSTLTPVIKILERARIGDGWVTIGYRKSLKWQDISFSALVIFQTQDRRIEIAGSE